MHQLISSLHEKSVATTSSKRSGDTDKVDGPVLKKPNIKASMRNESTPASSNKVKNTRPRRRPTYRPQKKLVDLTSLANPPGSPSRRDHATVESAMTDVNDSGSDEPPAFILRYSENRKRVLERDRKYPEIKACGWKPHCDCFATVKSAEKFAYLKDSTKKSLLSDLDNLATLLRDIRLKVSGGEYDAGISNVEPEAQNKHEETEEVAGDGATF
ncbi:unnamed protein product [Arabis nemorensis]|uniref:Uncharacterized protein n=1 Tax=Arabis nemorensis TaxID=586526 RepID=A0A565CRX1_9BRAS|nr:unnamed protein product [Arabis nemorensis]